MGERDSNVRELGLRLGARLVNKPPSVFEQLGITFTRDEWAEMNRLAQSDYPYPFADVVKFPAKAKEQGNG